jgi:hypothetical protein
MCPGARPVGCEPLEGDSRLARDKAHWVPDRAPRRRRARPSRPAHNRAQTEEVSTMRLRTILSAILCSAVLGTALGCSGQPTAPSTLASPSTVGPPSTAPGASQQTAVSPSRFGDRTPGVVCVASQGAVLRHVRGQRSVANERAVPALGERPNGVRSWPTGVSGRTVVGRFEWKRHAGPRGSFFPLSTTAAGTTDTVDQTCSA